MTKKDDLLYEIADLLFLSIDGSINKDQHDRLETLLYENPLAREYYYNLLLTTIGLNETEGILGLEEEFASELIWKALAEHEKTAPAIVIEKPVKPQETVGPVKIERRVSKLTIYTFIVSAAAMLLIMLMTVLSPVRPTVAVLTDSIHPNWGTAKNMFTNSDVLRQDDVLSLCGGFAEITFDNGAVVVLEGPATVQLESPSSMFITSGKISVVVSERAVGFTVNTPGADIVDLGTEFGVHVENGTCRLHMFEGKAKLVVGTTDNAPNAQVVHSNEARKVDFMTGTIQAIAMKQRAFARRIDSESGLIWRGPEPVKLADIDLADIVSGGDGFGSGEFGAAIHPETGQQTEGITPRPDNKSMAIKPSDNGFHPVTSLPFVDGVFVPNGTTQVNSAGDLFDCGPTSGKFYVAIANGARLRNLSVTENVHFQLNLDGINYNSEASPSIFMHANAGITFDLNEIRRTIPGHKIVQFKSICGITADVRKKEFHEGAAMNFWVLVDGAMRFQRIHVKPGASHGNKIQLPLNEQDRFLTLIATDYNQDIGFDWGFFGKPTLESQPE